MRLDKFLCKSTELDRAEAKTLIAAGAVRVNDDVVTNEATQVHENNCVRLDGQKLRARSSRYIMLHKPPATLCSNVYDIYPSLFHLIDVDKAFDLHIAGRLDADTTGLVLVTDDGRWSYGIMKPDAQCEKVYRVGLRDVIDDNAALELITRFEHGLQLQGEKALTLPAKLKVINPKEVLLTITEGRFHQVKRMFAGVGNRVLSLHRQKIGAVILDVGQGEWRHLTEDEIASF